MIRRLSTAAAFACCLAAPAVFAQQPPAAAPVATGRCTGVLCDLYYANKPAPAPDQPDVPDPTHLPCHDFLCAAFGGRTADAPSPAAQQPAPEPVRTAKHKRKARRAIASADSAKTDASK